MLPFLHSSISMKDGDPLKNIISNEKLRIPKFFNLIIRNGNEV